MRRREFITLLGGATAVWPLATRAQQGETLWRVGIFMDLSEQDAEGQARVAAFRKGLQELVRSLQPAGYPPIQSELPCHSSP